MPRKVTAHLAGLEQGGCMSLTIIRVAWGVIVATLPLNFLPHLPGYGVALIILLLAAGSGAVPVAADKISGADTGHVCLGSISRAVCTAPD